MSRSKVSKSWTIYLVLCVLLLFCWCISASSADSSFFRRRRQLAEIHRLLARVNKPAVKSIKVCVSRWHDAPVHPPESYANLHVREAARKPNSHGRPFGACWLLPSSSPKSGDGDIIDCVKRMHQPAFNHPAVRNHSLQTSPATPWPASTHGTSEFPRQMWHQSGKCPEGTVAIRRTSVKDVFRAGGVRQYMMKKNSVSSAPQRSQTQSDNGHEHAIGYMRGGLFYGTQATLNVWSPRVQVPSEFSLSQVWVLAGSFNNDLNSIEAGWQVSPQLYGDGNPRLFIYWTADSYQGTGCYNLLCSGFVQVSNAIAIGASITPLSSVGGSQYDISILIWKDPNTGNWWMQFGENHLVGYWPANLFTHLAASASMLEWGGEVVNSHPGGHHTATSMGSGQFPETGFARASYLRNIKYVDENNVLKTPQLRTLAEHPKCYNIQKGVNGEWGTYFYYGGPGQNAACA